MGMGSGISVMGKNTDLDANGIEAQQALISKLLMNAVQTPQQPDRSWTQGAARALSGIIGAYREAQLARKQDAYNKARQQSMSGLAAALSTGDPKQIAAAVANMKDPQSQMMGLEMLGKSQDTKNQKKMKIFETDEAIRKEKSDPVKQVQSQLNDVADKESRINSLINSTQDPQERQKLQGVADNIKATKESLLNQVRGVKGVEPDARKELANQGYAIMQSGGTPTPAMAEAMRSISLTPKLEPAMNAEIGKGIGQEINEEFKHFSDQAGSSRDIASKASQILQLLTSNPDVNGGLGKENITKVQTLMNRMFPGIAPNLADQQALQKLVGQLTPAAVGNLRLEGLQRITQGEVMNIVPKITATMENDRDGMKKILELHMALDAPIQKANAAMLQLRNQYAKNPGSFDIGSAMNDLQLALRKDVQEASMGYMNNILSKKGEKLMLNPNWDEKSNTLDKYVRVPSSQKDDEPLKIIPDVMPTPSPQGQQPNPEKPLPMPQDQQQASPQPEPISANPPPPTVRSNQDMDITKNQQMTPPPPTAQQPSLYGVDQGNQPNPPTMGQPQNNQMIPPQNMPVQTQVGFTPQNPFDQGIGGYMAPAPDKMSMLANILAKKKLDQNQEMNFNGAYGYPDNSF